MPQNAPLFDRAASAPPVPRGLPLVIALTGFTDAGGAVSQLIDLMRDDLDPIPLVVFDNDVLLDYRARRPLVTFDGERITGYRPSQLELSLVRDALGQPFLLLAGYEPDFVWEGFARAVLALAAEYAVASVTWLHAIPMPVPHTRPISTTVSGTRAALTEAHSVWRPHTQVPGTIGHLLEHRFAEAEVPVAGFVLLVPHYLGDTEYPAATLAALDSITAATGLVFAGDDLRARNREFLQRVQEQVQENEDLTRMLGGLEERYDAYMAGSTNAAPMVHTGDLPSADELAAELERFLASRPPADDGRGGPLS
ncbi:proteasome assembly chaperone family protein [Microbacterium elymi]|uniref:PAC2 family protein n=1 Tax=Microbacterium elymi TaxID=2909587 RepID=A0ABY5NJL1_9MICO|nr:PAC2 family protein [Microbacterium elymi]UUT35358.1 PAC2 family protein [Microbacterium elymi]